MLSIQDNGNGIPVDIQDRIFDPFFTTKRGKGGSGLGMHLVYNIVTQKLKGNIVYDDQISPGTKFIISFPAEL